MILKVSPSSTLYQSASFQFGASCNRVVEKDISIVVDTGSESVHYVTIVLTVEQNN